MIGFSTHLQNFDFLSDKLKKENRGPVCLKFTPYLIFSMVLVQLTQYWLFFLNFGQIFFNKYVTKKFDPKLPD